MLEMFPEWLQPLLLVLFIDVVLAGDNAIVVGMAAAGLPADQRKKAIFWGIIAATLMRIGFASITVQLLQIVGIVLAGGVLLLWVCWKMYRELRDGGSHGDPAVTEQHEGVEALENGAVPGAPKKTLRQAITQILVADVSMSLDNVLAVAG
ncbi:MAG: YjbE family putative metal transport protein, partial [Roseomonas sp.]|nr:YjbE family putative metal transport protein [Roseomonas sp.]